MVHTIYSIYVRETCYCGGQILLYTVQELLVHLDPSRVHLDPSRVYVAV
jgi:hypothetical protein